MVKLLGEVKVANFLENTLKQFSYKEITRENFMYKFPLNDSACTMGYEKKSKLLAKTYHFTVIIEKELRNSDAMSDGDEVQYYFQTNCWKAKKDSPLLKIANNHFLLNWAALDIESLKIIETKSKRLFKMVLLPGSYTSLLFPPLTQGIALYPEEIQLIENIIETMSKVLDAH